MMRRTPITPALLATSLLLTACNGGGSTNITLNNGGSGGIFGASSASSTELTPTEGRKLLLEIRKHPDKMKQLTPPERRFLAKSTVTDTP